MKDRRMQLSKEWFIFENTSPDNMPEAFRVMCKSLLKRFKSGEITIHELGYNICNALRIKEVAELEEFEELISMGCNIELPPNHQDGDSDRNQEEFLLAIENL